MTVEAGRSPLANTRFRLMTILDGSDAENRLAVIVNAVLVTLVIASVAAVVLESVPELEERFKVEFLAAEYLAAAVFTVEYGLRLWCAPDHGSCADMGPWTARLRTAVRPAALIDLVSIAPIYLQLFVAADFKVLLLLRLARFFKLARYSPGMQSLIAALEAERKALFAAGVLLFGVVLIAASAMHFVEHDVQPEKFGTIPQAMWWALVTLTTVGYGDVVPATTLGRFVASLTMVAGVVVLSLPIGIMATAFANEIHKREFVVTWGLIARVPLFSVLSAAEIADVVRVLRARTVASEEIIVRRGDPAHAMYFITNGEVEVELSSGPVRLGEGLFFGELALLHNTLRSANVRALRPTKLLVLEAVDFHRLIERNQDLGDRIKTLARERSAQAHTAADAITRAELADDSD